MPGFKHWMVAVIVLVGLLVPTLSASAGGSNNGHFDRTWERTDGPVIDGLANRTWMWGPAYSELGLEPYAESPGGEREVQYFDKSRMELTDPAGDPNSIWHVTNGLLVVEMTSGDIQVGHDSWESFHPANVNVAGDADDSTGPTYATIGLNISENRDLYDQGDIIDEVIDRAGWDAEAWFVFGDELAAYGVTAAEYAPATGKYTASVFWEFMNSSALVYENGNLVNAPLFQNAYYATGLPIDNPWWAEVKVGGTYKWVLVQCFERRCLTYTPDNPAGWQVEAGNVGQHYYEWRYGGDPVDPVSPPMTENEYIDAVFDIDDEFLASVEYLEIIWEDFDPHNATWVQQATSELAYWRVLALEMDELNPPASLAGVHQMMLDAYVYIVDASYLLESGIIENDDGLLEAGNDTFNTGWDMLADAFLALTGDEEPLTDEEYLDLIVAIDDAFLDSIDEYDSLVTNLNLDDPAWFSALVSEFEVWRELAWLMGEIQPPDSYAGVHLELLEAYALIELASWYIEDGINQLDVDLVAEGEDTLNAALDMLDDIFATFPSEW